MTSETWWHEGWSLKFPLEGTTNWTAKDTPWSTQACLRDLHVEKPKGGRIWANKGRGKGEVHRHGCRMHRSQNTARNSLHSWERGKFRLQVNSLWPWAFLPDRSACNTAELSDPLGRDLGAKTEYRRVRIAV